VIVAKYPSGAILAAASIASSGIGMKNFAVLIIRAFFGFSLLLLLSLLLILLISCVVYSPGSVMVIG
jgi:hypothetical protein